MSSETINPIDPTRFAAALESLPLDALHAKAAEITNSISHLRHSNAQMLPFAEAGDADCREAMFENLAVIGRMNERTGLLRAEVERRGMRWAEGEVEDKGATTGPHMANGDASEMVNGAVGTITNGTATVNSAVSGEVPAPRARSGRLTDEELRRQLEAQMGGAEEDDEGEDGVHL